MSEQTNGGENDVLKDENKTEGKAEVTQAKRSFFRHNNFTRILYPILTLVIGLIIGLSVSHFGEFEKEGNHGGRYEHYQKHGDPHYGHEGHHENDQDQRSKR